MKKVFAIKLCGSLTQTSKMACQSFSLPTSTCNIGSALRDVPGSVCSTCYAEKGFYKLYSTVATAQESRLEKLNQALQDPAAARTWIDAMKALIGKSLYFRWHDSGDVIDQRHASLIWQVAIEMPGCQFWLPTKESSLIRQCVDAWGCPDNLCIRLSMPMIDQGPTTGHGLNTSTVHRKNEPFGFACTAPSRGGYCGDCRACWCKDIPNTSFAFH